MEGAERPFTLNSVVDRFPLTKIKPAPTWHFIISSSEWFIVCGVKEPKREGEDYISSQSSGLISFFTRSVRARKKKRQVRKLPTNNNVSCNWSEVAGPGPAVKAHYLSDNRPGALQMLANEAVCLSYLPSLKWKREGGGVYCRRRAGGRLQRICRRRRCEIGPAHALGMYNWSVQPKLWIRC